MGFLAVTFQPVTTPYLELPSSESFPFIINKLLLQSETDIEIPQSSLVLFSKTDALETTSQI